MHAFYYLLLYDQQLVHAFGTHRDQSATVTVTIALLLRQAFAVLLVANCLRASEAVCGILYSPVPSPLTSRFKY